MLPPERRLGRVLELIDDRKYFTLHSGRQTGKTTCAFWLVDHLNASGRYRAAWVDLQTAREQPDLDRALPIILSEPVEALLDPGVVRRAGRRPDAADRLTGAPGVRYAFPVSCWTHLPRDRVVTPAHGLLGAGGCWSVR